MLVLIRGAGDIASGIALRLWRCGFDCILTDLPHPTSIRRTVCFSEAIRLGKTMVEEAAAVYADSADVAFSSLRAGIIPVLADPELTLLPLLSPDVLVDAILAKKNLGTRSDMAKAVIGVGPGFTVGQDCHAAVETMRGHNLGHVIWQGSPLPNTNIPGLIGGYAGERVIRAPIAGVFTPEREIGCLVSAGDRVANVSGASVCCTISGVLRGILPEGTEVHAGMKAGDVDPRANPDACTTCSDKAMAVAGGVLEAIMMLTNVLHDKQPKGER